MDSHILHRAFRPVPERRHGKNNKQNKSLMYTYILLLLAMHQLMASPLRKERKDYLRALLVYAPVHAFNIRDTLNKESFYLVISLLVAVCGGSKQQMKSIC